LSLKLIDIKKAFVNSRQGVNLPVLDGISHCIQQGRFVSLVGPSGGGKSTLLRIIAGLENSFEGKVILDGSEITKTAPEIGLVFQDYALFPWRTMIENIAIGLEIKGVGKRERKAAAREYIELFGLRGFENRHPAQLSGGMQQRVAIARTLIVNPRVVLMDEPFASLDSQTRNDMQEFLLDIRQRRNETVVFVTHNVDEAVFLSDEVVVLSKRPAKVVKVFDVPLPRPRDRTGAECNSIRREIMECLKEQRSLNQPV
jgi:NitT/TauT family transport system ATP-binding protein